MSSEIPENGQWDITVRAGSHFAIDFDLVDDDGVALDTDGWIGYAQARNEAGDVLVQFTVSIDAGTVSVTAEDTDTADLAEDGEWECKIDSGNVTTMVWGIMTHQRQVAFV